MDEKKYVVVEEADMTAIGDAIRYKEESTEKIPTKEMPGRIRAIESGVKVTGTITVTDEDAGKTIDVSEFEFAFIDISSSAEGTLTIDGSMNNQTIYPTQWWEKIVVSVPTTVVDMTENGMIDNSMVQCVIPESMTKIVPYAFYNLTSLKELTIGSGIVSIGGYAFYGCSGLENLIVPSNVTTVNTYMFANCTGLKTLQYNPKVLAQYAFDGCEALESLLLPNITNVIPAYAFRNCKKLKNLNETFKNFPASASTSYGILSYAFAYAGASNGVEDAFDFTPNNSFYIGSYALAYSNVKKIDFKPWRIASNAFAYTKALESIKLRYNSSYTQVFEGSYIFAGSNVKSVDLSELNGIRLYDYSFQNCIQLEEFKAPIATHSSYPYIHQYCFYAAGSKRADLTQKLIFDFGSTGKITYCASYSFANLVNTDVILPSTVTSIYANAFNGSKQLNLFLNSSPTLANVNAFTGCDDLKVFIDISLVDALMEKTNWATYKDNIKGMVTGVTELPTTTSGGLDVLWYIDSDFTQLVGDSVIDSSATYYCKIGPYYLTKVTGLNCSVIVSDSSDKVYVEGDQVILGTTLDLAFQPAEGQEVPYQIKINGVAIDLTDFNNTYTGVFFDDNLSIVAIYWDGVTMPYNPTFADNDWSLIALGIKSRVGFDIGWKIGDTKSVTTTDGKTYTLRIADITADRYAYADGSGNSQAVIEFVEGLPTTMTINDSAKEGAYTGGGWALCDMNNIKLPNFLATLPSELQEAISEVALTGYSYTSPSPRTGNSKLFLPNEYEIWGRRYYSNAIEETTQFQLYAQEGAAAMKKYRLGSTSNEYFWTRSPCSGNYNFFVVWHGTDYDYSGTNNSFGVAPVFAI